MAYVDWKITGKKIGACNCNYGCPCEFNAPPTYGVCEGLEAMEIEEGYFGDVRLDALAYAILAPNPHNMQPWKIELDGDEAYVSNYVEPGVNVLAEIGDPFNSDAGLGFDDPDNLAIAPNGDLYITEDDSPGDIWVARGSGRDVQMGRGAELLGVVRSRA